MRFYWLSSSLSALGCRFLVLVRRLGLLRLHVDERLGHEARADGPVDLRRERVDADLLDVDDAREVTEAIEEDRQVVVAAFDADRDGPFGIRVAPLLLPQGGERGLTPDEVALADERLDFLHDLLGVA